jgi:hypothetical protein
MEGRDEQASSSKLKGKAAAQNLLDYEGHEDHEGSHLSKTN